MLNTHLIPNFCASTGTIITTTVSATAVPRDTHIALIGKLFMMIQIVLRLLMSEVESLVFVGGFQRKLYGTTSPFDGCIQNRFTSYFICMYLCFEEFTQL